MGCGVHCSPPASPAGPTSSPPTPGQHSARAAPRELHVGYAVPRRDWLDRWRDWLIMRRGSENRAVGRRWRLAQALLGVAVVGVAGLIIGRLVMDPARGPESLPSAGPAGVGCVAEPGAQQRDIDTDDSPEFPWGHTPGEEVTVYFETGELPARYVQMVETGARTWSRSPCIKALAVDRCPGGTNCTKVLVEERGDDRDTDGESAGVQRDGVRVANTITLYTELLDDTADNGALATVTHEMGHALGLVHRNESTSLMNAETDDDTSPIPDETDFANLLVIYGQP